MFIWDYSYVIWKANGLVLNHADGNIYLTFVLKRHRNQSRLTAVSIKQLLRRVTNILFNYSHKDTTVPFFVLFLFLSSEQLITHVSLEHFLYAFSNFSNLLWIFYILTCRQAVWAISDYLW